MAYKKKRGTLSLLLLIILLIIFIYSIIEIIIYLYDSNRTKELYDDLMSSLDVRELSNMDENDRSSNDGEAKARPLVDFNELKIVNNDTVRIS